MARAPRAVDGWPRFMRAETASAYCDEPSVDTFQRGVGKLWPRPKWIPGKGYRWLRDDLDRAIEGLMAGGTVDAADLL